MFQEPSENRKTHTAIVVFDSLGGRRTSAVKNITDYLVEEYKEKLGLGKDKSHQSQIVLNPDCPQQEDVTSCGIFLLHYVEQLLARY